MLLMSLFFLWWIVRYILLSCHCGYPWIYSSAEILMIGCVVYIIRLLSHASLDTVVWLSGITRQLWETLNYLFSFIPDLRICVMSLILSFQMSFGSGQVMVSDGAWGHENFWVCGLSCLDQQGPNFGNVVNSSTSVLSHSVYGRRMVK